MSIRAQRKSLHKFMDSAWSDKRSLSGLDSVIDSIAEGVRRVQRKVQSAALADVLGSTGEINIQGEMVQRLDAAGADIFVELLRTSGSVAAVCSDEIEDSVIVGDDVLQAYIVHMDPVDGSSNIDVAVTIGSIFGIWRRTDNELVGDAMLLRRGREQVAAAYVVYGSSTVLVVATAGHVNGFTLDTESGEFALTHPSVKFPSKCEYYSTNEGNYKKLDEPTQQAISKLRHTKSLRYVGSLVADFHRNLLKGGIFLYLGDTKSPQGKLRLMYEANPLGFIAEQAGGAAYSDKQRILDIEPDVLHQRTPLIIGNKSDVEETVSIINRQL